MGISTNQKSITRGNVGPFKSARGEVALSVITCIEIARDISGAAVIYIFVGGPSIHQPALTIQPLVIKTGSAWKSSRVKYHEYRKEVYALPPTLSLQQNRSSRMHYKARSSAATACRRIPFSKL